MEITFTSLKVHELWEKKQAIKFRTAKIIYSIYIFVLFFIKKSLQL